MVGGKLLTNYLGRIEKANPGISGSLIETLNAIVPGHIGCFSYQDHVTGLLMGEVQSGKTTQMFGIIAAAADLGFKLFIVLTSDNVNLQQQTYRRALKDLEEDFNVCSETDVERFIQGRLRRPVLIILKKNTRVLGTWRDNLASSGYCKTNALFFVDDEADAASPNIKINHGQQSTINAHLDSMKHIANSSIYIQVTATPQALLLQSQTSGWKPMFMHYFTPGKGYLGGRFYYSIPRSYAINIIDENELDTLIDSPYIAEGLASAILCYLIVCAQATLDGDRVCNMLVHPSVLIDHHDTIAAKISLFLEQVQKTIDEQALPSAIFSLWEDLQSTKPDILPFEEVIDVIKLLKPKVIIVNSDQPIPKYDDGLNIIVGGNSLARGITFPALQTVYYCRSAKRPQSDTYWQHCRMFGYDREPALMRMFLPESLLELFTELNSANATIIKQIRSSTIENIGLLYPAGIRPTRPAAVDRSLLQLIVGGTNYFPREPRQNNAAVLDDILKEYEEGVHDIAYETAGLILDQCQADDSSLWESGAVSDCIRTIEGSDEHGKAVLIVRRGRKISKGTGTLLSPTDRLIGSRISDRTVITLYRLEGTRDQGWDGMPFWIANVKLPKGKNFHLVLD